METKKRGKRVIIGLVAAVVILFLLANWFYWFGVYTLRGQWARNHYDSIDMLQTVQDSEFGAYSDRHDWYHHKTVLVFSSDAAVIRMSYTPESYAAQKAELDKQAYYTEPLYDDSLCILSEGEFDIHEWHFRVSQESQPPKELKIIGYNEKKNEIAYVYFSDGDLDEIDKPMAVFFRQYIGYSF